VGAVVVDGRLEQHDPLPHRLDELRSPARRVLVAAVVDRDVHAIAGERDGDRGADAAATTRDEGYSVVAHAHASVSSSRDNRLAHVHSVLRSLSEARM